MLDKLIGLTARRAIQSIGFLILAFFALAFSCDRNDRSGSSGTTPTSDTKSTAGGGCSTATEFREVLTAHYRAVFNERDGKLKEPEIDFENFEIGDAQPYRADDLSVNVDRAYPVRVDHTVRHYIGGKYYPRMQLSRVRGKYLFYVDPRGACSYVNDGSNVSPAEVTPLDQD